MKVGDVQRVSVNLFNLRSVNGVALVVRAESPVAGSLTALRLRRARSREDLQALITEVEARVGKPPRSLSAALAIQQVRTLLAGPRQLAWASR